MRKLLIALFVLAAGTTASAQAISQMHQAELTQQGSPRIEPALTFINGQEITMRTLILSNDNIAETRVLNKGTEEALKYDPKGKKNVLLLTTKSDIELVRYEQILDHFNIPAAQRNLKVSINRGSLVNPELILADLSEIKAVEVKEAGPREFAHWGWNQGEKFLNIITKDQEE